MEKNKKRYVVTVDMYVYAENDYMARKRAHKLKKEISSNNRHGADPSISEIGSQPFASMNYRKLEDISKPSDKSKDDPLPF